MKKVILFSLLALTLFSGIASNANTKLNTSKINVTENLIPIENSISESTGSFAENNLAPWWRKLLRWLRYAVDFLDDNIPYEEMVNNSSDGDTFNGKVNVLFGEINYAEAQNLGITITENTIDFNSEFKVMETSIKTLSVQPGQYQIYQNEYGDYVANVTFIVHDK